MKFRRKSEAAAVDDAPELDETPRVGPFDADDLPDDGVERVDLGSLLIEPQPDRELRIQVDDSTGVIQAVLLAGAEGAVEFRAFAAPRNGDLWSEVRPQIAADMAQRGGTATEREGRFGTELVCELTVRRDDGATGTQPSRVIGINGPRWLLRATLIGRPAAEPETAQEWEDAISRIAVRRGTGAIAPGEPLPVVMPETARRVDPPTS